ncbi:MAG: hypothetical protein U9Q18_01175 [Caldisericota bacterium]|nr:hypothetical protein [Caldisericota bacterium]
MNVLSEFAKMKHLWYRSRENKTRWQKQKIRIIEKFLRHCKNRGVKKIGAISKSEYDSFFLGFKNTIETKRKYMFVLREFFKKAGVSIKVNTLKYINKQKQKKLKQIEETLPTQLTEETKNKILKIL